MATPAPFTFSSLDTFKNCPKQYHETYVLKNVKTEQSPQMIYGTDVHTHFQNRLESGTPLPEHLAPHELKMNQLLAKEGVFWCEAKVALDRRAQPCNYDERERLWRGAIDFRLVDPLEQHATIVDFKTGKKHDKWVQIAMYAIHTFALFPNVETVNAQFYWTQQPPEIATTKKVWGRDDIPMLWSMFTNDLKQYKEAWKTDVWQPRPSGLCYGWCPVKTCQHWKPHKPGRP